MPYDDWRTGRGGFRVDWDPGRSGDDVVTLQGDYYDTPAGTQNTVPTLTPPFSTTFDTTAGYSGSNVLSRWKHIIDNSATGKFKLTTILRSTSQELVRT